MQADTDTEGCIQDFKSVLFFVPVVGDRNYYYRVSLVEVLEYCAGMIPLLQHRVFMSI